VEKWKGEKVKLISLIECSYGLDSHQRGCLNGDVALPGLVCFTLQALGFTPQAKLYRPKGLLTCLFSGKDKCLAAIFSQIVSPFHLFTFPPYHPFTIPLHHLFTSHLSTAVDGTMCLGVDNLCITTGGQFLCG